ncbi:Tyrosine recombinase XerC [bioreactor metagenome]|uniref:Tyrosine recombinase XerC n=1 Tax=bioreactor metagenome TaxID=1076179 RepID=A0A645BS42_9ZZZZ
MDYRTEAPELIRQFLTYQESILGHSRATADEYFLDLRSFFRYIKKEKRQVPSAVEFQEIDISDLDLNLVRSVAIVDVYSYMSFLVRDRDLGAAARARQVAAIRSFYKYLTVKAKLLKENPMQDLDSPRQKKMLPRYLQFDESIQLLESVSGPNQERDYCILTLFLNCGLRISELVGLNLADVRGDQLRVLGKGNKERVLYLNGACKQALEDWLAVRSTLASMDKNALFITRRHARITKAAVHKLVKKHILEAGLDPAQYSSHKLRHTAATLMLHNGVDVRTLQEMLGHEHLNTTQIYTHVDSESLRNAAAANPLGKVRLRKKPAKKTEDPEQA